MTEGIQRRLAAIMAADVAGYSRLMGEDEDGTLSALRHLRTKIFVPTVDQHKGEVVKSMGDGWLVEFGSVADAVTCAIEVQEKLADRACKVLDRPDEPLVLASKRPVCDEPADHTDRKADKDLVVQRHPLRFVGRVVIKVGHQLAFVVVGRDQVLVVLGHNLIGSLNSAWTMSKSRFSESLAEEL